ncbi:MAG: hypothetical protein F6K58_27960 [Symploca sp. SIO2E9]|nr:hypothetical protein [Symploca sp. SIO2E9]
MAIAKALALRANRLLTRNAGSTGVNRLGSEEVRECDRYLPLSPNADIPLNSIIKPPIKMVIDGNRQPTSH